MVGLFMDDPTDLSEKAFATGWFRGAKIVADYMHRRYQWINDAINKAETPVRDACIKGLWMRAYAWMQTLARLNDPLDFQAVAIGDRALLELAVDLVLLYNDKTNESGWRMHWWGLSEKLKASELILNYYQSKNLPLPDQYEVQKQFYDNERTTILDMRATLWPNRKNPDQHPSRWTTNGNLFDDILRADQLSGAIIVKEIGSSFEEYYRTEYRKINWHIHSGTNGFWNLPPEAYYLSYGFGLKSSADLCMLSTKLVLTDFQYLKAFEGLQQEWEDIAYQRNLVYVKAMQEDNSESSHEDSGTKDQNE